MKLDNVYPANFRAGVRPETSCHKPWGLVRIATGTQVAWLTRWIADGTGNVVAFEAITFNRNGRQMQSRPKRFDFRLLISDWRERPGGVYG